MAGVQGVLKRIALDTRPLSIPAYRRLLVGQGVSFVGFQLTSVAVSGQVYNLTGSSLWVGMLGPVSLVPLVVFGLWGGAVADAMDRRRLLLAGSVVAWLSTVALLLHAWSGLGSVYLILAVIALQSIGFAVTSATRGAIIPRIVPTERVPAANTLNFLVSSIGTVVGPLLAGVVLAKGGYATAYLIDAVLFGAGFYAAVRLPTLAPVGEISRPGLRSVVDGLRYVVSKPVVLMSFVVDIIAMAFAMPRALFPEMAAERFGGSTVAFGWLSASIAIGAVVAGVFSGWVGRVRRQGVALTLVIALWGVTVTAAALAQPLWLVVALLAIGGATDLASAVWRQTILQTYAPDEMRGRLQGVFMVVVAGGPRLGDLRAGATADAFGLVSSWAGGGLICALLVLVTGFGVSAFRRYDALASRPDAR
ncbi:MFS transporter [Microbispora bryophytorum]|uniref:MFS transporter n=2 Tax=Microbispora bryophytorum TaxID=1460882 RepID=A0A8H9H4N7_9ACTN|nr:MULTISPECIES: MFS transporter [Microbispora]MBD3137121.1 MFS transporter [Microbispora bryophytorum]MBD3148454.1 MFS transporter [Microbispora camponoti]TQS07365.1 MFS transporter [Microbispora bryophytorum]GGO14559.1 MFS transporter [Microbispora bryophytorum]